MRDTCESLRSTIQTDDAHQYICTETPAISWFKPDLICTNMHTYTYICKCCFMHILPIPRHMLHMSYIVQSTIMVVYMHGRVN